LAAKAALERAFATTAAALHPPVRRGRAVTARRPPDEMAQVAERLLEAVQACPGETMNVIAARVGEPPRALNRPMVHLKRAGRVRSAGERNLTRYFPMVVKA
jgi:hypothetical protein